MLLRIDLFQYLVDSFEVGGNHQGLSLIPGVVKKIPLNKGLKLPHMGWNGIFLKQPQPLNKYL